jgi:diaminopimelate epimerase
MDVDLNAHQVSRLCDRKYGVGSDGLILIKRSEQFDFKMDFFNPDGSKSFCGNGARCAVHYSYANQIVTKNPCSFEAIDGVHSAFMCMDEVKIKMGDVGTFETLVIPTNSGPKEGYFLDTGSPHFVQFVKHKKELEGIIEIGRKIRFSKHYETNGVNVNLVEVSGENKIVMRTYERGVENETLSCGTGATACALAYARVHHTEKNLVKVETRGGELKVSFEQLDSGLFSDVYLIGPAKHVFNGQIDV